MELDLTQPFTHSPSVRHSSSSIIRTRKSTVGSKLLTPSPQTSSASAQFDAPDSLRKTSLLGKQVQCSSRQQCRTDARYRRLQSKIYNFLERPKTLASIIYHVVVFSCVFICLNFSVLSTVRNFEKISAIGLFYMEKVMLFWFFAEYCIRVWSAGCRSRYQTWRGRLRFMRKPLCIVDVIVIIASIVVLSLGTNSQRFAPSPLRGLRFFQILRMIRMDRRGGTWKLLASVVSAHRQELFTTAYIGFLVLISSSFLLYMAERESNDKIKSYADALWWGVVTLCTVGYGDTYPKTWMGKIVAAFCSVAGISFFALPAGILGSGFALKVQQHQREKHLIRRRVPAATLIQCLWRCYAADVHSISVATWKIHMNPLSDPITGEKLTTRLARLSSVRRLVNPNATSASASITSYPTSPTTAAANLKDVRQGKTSAMQSLACSSFRTILADRLTMRDDDHADTGSLLPNTNQLAINQGHHHDRRLFNHIDDDPSSIRKESWVTSLHQLLMHPKEAARLRLTSMANSFRGQSQTMSRFASSPFLRNLVSSSGGQPTSPNHGDDLVDTETGCCQGARFPTACNNGQGRTLTPLDRSVIRALRKIKYFVARRKFREALRPYDVKDVIEQYAAGHLDMLGRIKILQFRLDQILGRSSIRPEDQQEIQTSLASRFQKIEQKVVTIDSKLDLLIKHCCGPTDIGRTLDSMPATEDSTSTTMVANREPLGEQHVPVSTSSEAVPTTPRCTIELGTSSDEDDDDGHCQDAS